jgi:1-acyl-sn-glycerol-3-phosphate acyltransferase
MLQKWKFRRIWIKMAIPILGIRVQSNHVPIIDTALFVSNHRSFLDPVVILNYVHAVGVSKAEVANYPLLGKAIADTGVVYVKRESSKSRKNAKEQIAAILKKGLSVLLFPEGTTSNEETTKTFKKGSFEIAVAAKVPVVPVALIFNKRKFHWEGVGLIEHFFTTYGWSTPRVKVIFGSVLESNDPIQLHQMAREEINSLILKHQFETDS